MALPPLGIVVVGLTQNAAHSMNKFQMAPEGDAPPVADDLYIRLKVNKADNTLTIIDSGVGMTNQGLADIVRKGRQNISSGIGVTFYTASLVVRKVAVRTKHNNGCQYICESMEDGSFHISRDDNAEQLHKGTEITLFLYENQLEYLEEEAIKDLVKKECGSIGYPIYLKVEKEPELNQGEIQEVAEWQVIHEPNALEPGNNPSLVASVNREAEAGAKDPKAEAGRLRQEPIELAVELPNNIAIILSKPKKSVWKRMIERLGACAITQVAVAAIEGLEFALCGDGA